MRYINNPENTEGVNGFLILIDGMYLSRQGLKVSPDKDCFWEEHQVADAKKGYRKEEHIIEIVAPVDPDTITVGPQVVFLIDDLDEASEERKTAVKETIGVMSSGCVIPTEEDAERHARDIELEFDEDGHIINVLDESEEGCEDD